ncbi:hypothetical protein QJS66_11970 [Kocuria rhizophila]|nr:hypothetical protein QJS66_11970 [Kocuria rhizophila]
MTPLRFLERSAEVFPDRRAVVRQVPRMSLPGTANRTVHRFATAPAASDDQGAIPQPEGTAGGGPSGGDVPSRRRRPARSFQVVF